MQRRTQLSPLQGAIVNEDSPHVLLVDDDPSFRRYAARSLRLGGFRCTTSNGITDALGRVEGEPFDLFVVDLRMDDGTGLDFLRRLPERRRMIPAIIVTAQPDLDSAVQSLRMSVIDYVNKPVDDLAARAHSALDRSRARHALMRTADALDEWSTWVATASERLDQLCQSLIVPPPLKPAVSAMEGSALPLEALSPREYEVVELLAEGLSNKELAERLSISLHTVKNHIKSVFRKLEVGSRLELVSRLQRQPALS